MDSGLLFWSITANRINDPEIDIWRTAGLTLKYYAGKAPLEAARCPDELLAEGDIKGCAVWKRILVAVTELQKIRARI